MDAKDRILNGLAEDLQVAGAFLALKAQLRTTMRKRTPLVFKADAFLWHAIRAFRDSSVIHLWKVYDNNSAARSLIWFVTKYSTQSKSIRQQDLTALATSDAAVARLKEARNALFAHRSRQAMEREESEILEANNLTDEEFSVLTHRGLEILGRHYGSALPRKLPFPKGEAVSQFIELDNWISAIERNEALRNESVDGDVKARGKHRW